MRTPKDGYLIKPDPLDPRLTERVRGIDQTGQPVETAVVVDAGDHVVHLEHVLVEQKSEREIFRIVTDRHRGDNFLGV